MKTISKPNIFLLSFFSIFLFTACEKVIDVDLNEANPQIVIDASLCNGVQDFQVKIGKTTSFYNVEVPETVDNATVKLTVDGDATYPLEFKSKGCYELKEFEGKVGSVYALSVKVDDREYLATAQMQPPVPIDRVTWVPHLGGFSNANDEKKFTLFCEFKDPGNRSDYYMVVAPANDSAEENFWLSNDEHSSGEAKKVMLQRHLFNGGDTVKVELHSVDADVYQFYRTLSDIISNSVMNSAAPSNPETNFNNGALGCFDVFSKNEYVIVLPE